MNAQLSNIISLIEREWLMLKNLHGIYIKLIQKILISINYLEFHYRTKNRHALKAFLVVNTFF